MYVCFEFSLFLWTSYDRALSCDLYQATRLLRRTSVGFQTTTTQVNSSFILLFDYIHVCLSVCCVISQFHAALVPTFGTNLA